MRRIGIVILTVSALFTISVASAAEPKNMNARKAPVSSAVQLDSPLVRAAKISLQARMHPKSRVIIDSTTLVVSRWSQPSVPAAGSAPEAQGRSWASGNSGEASAIASQERNAREQRAAAEKARQESLRQEQAYMAAQDQEPYSEVIDDHVTNRLETIPTEIKKPPM